MLQTEANITQAAEPNPSASGIRPAAKFTEPPQVAQLHRSQNADQRVPILDGLRASAAVLVFLGHATAITDGVWVDGLWARLFTLNGLGAILFFILSGFLITEVLLKADRTPKYFFRNFYARRALRLLPLYYLVIFYAFVLRPSMHHLGLSERAAPTGSPWAYLAGVSNFLVAARKQWVYFPLDVTWSLAIEFQFYVLWPIAIYFLPRRNLLVLSIGMILFGIAYRLLAVYVWQLHPLTIYVSSFSRVGAFGWGAAVALALRDPALLMRMRPYATGVAMATLPVIWLVIGFEDSGTSSYQKAYGVHGGPVTFSVLVSFVSIGICGLIVRCLVATREGILHSVFCSWPLTHFAKYSYAFFLLHVPVVTALRSRVFGPPWVADLHPAIKWFDVGGSYIPAQILFYLLAFVCTLIPAFFAWHLYEKQWLKLSRFFPSRPPAPPTPPAPAASSAPASAAGSPAAVGG